MMAHINRHFLPPPRHALKACCHKMPNPSPLFAWRYLWIVPEFFFVNLTPDVYKLWKESCKWRILLFYFESSNFNEWFSVQDIIDAFSSFLFQDFSFASVSCSGPVCLSGSAPHIYPPKNICKQISNKVNWT